MESFKPLQSEELSDADLLRGRDLMLDQMAWARQYTSQLLEATPGELWYVQPAGAPTHVAWQVGHLAVAQYGLMLFRQRGRSPADLNLMPGWLRKQFGRGTSPESLSRTPTVEELLERLKVIDAQAFAEVRQLTAETLRETTELPYAAYPNKLGALLFCPLHESLHAGQVGVLRRLHGLDPVR